MDERSFLFSVILRLLGGLSNLCSKSIKVLMGNAPHVLLKVPKGERNTEFIREVLEKYAAFREIPGKGNINS